MVKIFRHNNRLCKIKITGQAFKMLVAIVKSMPVRNYVKEEKKWFIPITDVKLLIKKLENSNHEYLLEKDIANDYIKARAFRSQLKSIKKVTNEYIVKNMDILNKPLMPFQTIGAYFAYKAKNAIIGDVVGLGKTAMSLSAAERLFDELKINSVIVLCPPTLKRNWEEEIIKFTDRSSTVIFGDKGKRKKAYKYAYKNDFIIIPYDILFRDYDEYIYPFILSRNFRYLLIMDECQYIKNSSAKRSKFTKYLSEQASYRLALTATALENRVLELYNIYQSIDNLVFGDGAHYKHFIERYCELDYWGGIKGVKMVKTIRNRMASSFIKRFKEDVIKQLPKRIENNLWIDLSDIQRRIYNDIKSKIAETIEDAEKSKKIKMANILSLMAYLRQACLSAKLVGVSENISTKTEVLLDFLDSLDDKSKVVIFTHFRLMTELLQESLEKIKFNSIFMHGRNTQPDDRISAIKYFNDTPTLRALITTDILNMGVNITSANYCINFDLLFNPAKMEQRNGRIDRLDTKYKTLNIVNIMTENTIEEKMFAMLADKEELSKRVIDGGRIEKRKVKLTFNNIKHLLDL
jgi:SNF2 family DNA or RNA helicase